MSRAEPNWLLPNIPKAADNVSVDMYRADLHARHLGHVPSTDAVCASQTLSHHKDSATEQVHHVRSHYLTLLCSGRLMDPKASAS